MFSRKFQIPDGVRLIFGLPSPAYGSPNTHPVLGQAMISWSIGIVESQKSRSTSKVQIEASVGRTRPAMSFLKSTSDVIGFLLLAVVSIVEGIIKSLIPMKYRMKNIDGEIALVTGGGGGLGRLIALRLANLGAIVVIWDVNKAGKLQLSFLFRDETNVS